MLLLQVVQPQLLPQFVQSLLLPQVVALLLPQVVPQFAQSLFLPKLAAPLDQPRRKSKVFDVLWRPMSLPLPFPPSLLSQWKQDGQTP
jgi:hypothetical protein